MDEKKSSGQHSVLVNDRRNGTVTGVKEVDSFNENEIQMLTECGRLLIKGENLHVKELHLEKGEAQIEGKINSLTYATNVRLQDRKSLVKRMFQ